MSAALFICLWGVCFDPNAYTLRDRGQECLLISRGLYGRQVSMVLETPCAEAEKDIQGVLGRGR